jgi:hypothetical protein
MRLQDTYTNEEAFSKIFMKNNVRITVWRHYPTALCPERYCWHIQYHSRDGKDYLWNIPWPDLYTILPDLARDMNQDVAIVIYEALWEWFNETLYQFQMGDWLIAEGIVTLTNCCQIMFPPKEDFSAELQLIEAEKGRITTTTDIWGTFYYAQRHPTRDDYRHRIAEAYRWDDSLGAWLSNRSPTDIQYMTSEEYERARDEGRIDKDTLYLITN